MPLISDDGLLSACPPAETHKFYFCPDMEPDECWLFKQWDTRKDKGARVCFHSAVHDPFHDMDGIESISGLEGRLRSHTVSRMPTRRSLECRLVMTFPSAEHSTAKLQCGARECNLRNICDAPSSKCDLWDH